MTSRNLISRALLIMGFAAMAAGIVHPIEGSFIILPGSGLAALGAFLGRRRLRRPVFWSFVLIAAGFGAVIAMSAVGGVGGDSGRSAWWLLTALPLPVGWILGIASIILTLAEPV